MSRIAYVSTDPGVPVYGRKGASVHVQSVVRELLRRGHEVHLVAARVGGDVPRGLEDVVLHELPRISGTPGPEREASARITATAAAVVLADLDRQEPLGMVYERYSLWSEASMLWAAEHGVPSVLEVNAPLIDEQARHRVLADRDGAETIAARAFAAADSVICVTPAVADWVSARVGEDQHVHVVGNGVDTRHIRPRRMQPATVRGSGPGGPHTSPSALPHTSPTGESPFTVGFVGTLKPWHGVEVLVEAFARLSAGDPDVRLRLVGDGPQREAIEELAAALGVADRVDLVGAVDPEEMPEQLAAMDVAVAPYPQLEDFYFSPLKIYEYLAAGLPVVASDIGEVAPLLGGGDIGMLVTPGSVSQLAAVLAGLQHAPELRAVLGENAREAAVARYDWSLVLDRILATVPARSTTLAEDLLGRTT